MRWQNVETPTFEGSAGSNGEPAVVETMTLVDRDGAEVMTVTKAVDGVKSIDVGGSEVTATQLANLITYGNPTGVKVYRALLTQTGTDAPVATVLENTLGGTVVWTYAAGGRYDGTLAGAFTANKTAVNSGSCVTAAGSALNGWFAGNRTNADAVRLISSTANDPSSTGDDVLVATLVEIFVYP